MRAHDGTVIANEFFTTVTEVPKLLLVNDTIFLAIKRSVAESEGMSVKTSLVCLIVDVLDTSLNSLKRLTEWNMVHIKSTHQVGLLILNAFSNLDVLALNVDFIGWRPCRLLCLALSSFAL